MKSKPRKKASPKKAGASKTKRRSEKRAAPVEQPLPSIGQTRISMLVSLLPHTIGADQPLAKAHALMRSHGIRHLPVLEGGKLVGMLSERDLHLIETFKDVDPNVAKVGEALLHEPFSVRYDATVADVARTMADFKYGAAAVVDDDGQVIGVFTTTDALRALIDA
jgi:acetoin utilization protein AcuB